MGETPITGYRKLTVKEIETINKVKALAEDCNTLIKSLEFLNQVSEDFPMGIDKRWLAIGTTQLQQGFMAVNRAIAQPTTF